MRRMDCKVLKKERWSYLNLCARWKKYVGTKKIAIHGCIILLTGLFWYFYGDWIYSLPPVNAICAWGDIIYINLGKECRLKILLLILTSIPTFYFCWHIIQERCVKLITYDILIISLILLHVNNPFIYIAFGDSFDFRCFLTILLFLLLCLLVIKDFYSDVLPSIQCTPFTTNQCKTDLPPKQTQYAQKIASRLLATDISQHSYALGITGKWGTGKTTFLQQLRKNMLPYAYVIDFNPWMCKSSEQVVDSFFSLLSKSLSPHYRSLGDLLLNYARYINDAADTPVNKFMTLIFHRKRQSLQERKEELSSLFQKLDRPVVVCIDDLDRMEHDEIFEVLRLIRNTADLNNMIYVVVYDKEYVVEELTSKKIKDAEIYLEKIFDVELHQPMVEDYQLYDVLSNDMDKMFPNRNFSTKLFRYINPDERDRILHILGSFRRAKRFARQFIHNVDYIIQTAPKEYKLIDLFWLELLQMYDKEVYDTLFRDPKRLLYVRREQYSLRNGITSTPIEGEKYEGGKFWKTETPELLWQLFGQINYMDNKSICYIENFEKYFALSIAPHRLSRQEFMLLFNEETNVEEKVKQWLFTDQKYISSIFNNIETYPIKNQKDQTIEKYLEALLVWGKYTLEKPSRNLASFHNLLSVDSFPNDKRDYLNAWIMSWFNRQIENTLEHVNIACLLKCLYQTDFPNDNIVPLLLITNNQIVELMQKNACKYLQQYPKIDVLSVYNKSCTLGRIMSNSCVLKYSDDMNGDINEWGNEILGVITEHFSINKKYTKQEFENARNEMMKIDEPSGLTGTDLVFYYDEQAREMHQEFIEYFGSEEAYHDFVSKCAKEA